MAKSNEAAALRSILDRLSELAAQGPVTIELQCAVGCPMWFVGFGAAQGFGESLEQALRNAQQDIRVRQMPGVKS